MDKLFKSIRLKLFFRICIIILIILIFLIVVNNAVLETYFYYKKTNTIINLYNERGIEVPYKINICNPLNDSNGCIFENTANLYNWLKNDRDRELVIINDDVYKLYYKRTYNRWDDFVGYELTMEHIGKISK